MSDGLYRDPLLGMKAQIGERRAALGRLEARVSDILVAVLPEPLRSRLRELRARADRDGETLEELHDRERAVGELEGALRAAIDMSFDLAAEPDELPRPEPESPRPFLIEERWLEKIRLCLEEDLARVDGGARTERWGDFETLSTFQLDGAQAMLRMSAALQSSVATVGGELTMPIATGIEPLRLAPETAWHRVGKRVGWVEEADLDDRPFDEAYLVEVRSDLASALLTRDVRRALSAVAVVRPTIDVRDGVLRAAWDDATVRAATRFYTDVRLPLVDLMAEALACMHREAARIWT